VIATSLTLDCGRSGHPGSACNASQPSCIHRRVELSMHLLILIPSNLLWYTVTFAPSAVPQLEKPHPGRKAPPN
jgi:hypothetical protein